MGLYHVQVTLLAQSGETADAQVNTFAFSTPATVTEAEVDDYTLLVKAFYDELRTAGALLGLAQNGHTVKFYNAVTTVPNYPIFTKGFNLNVAPGAIDLPLEVSLCISFMNDIATNVSPRRRRGRIYISGFNEAGNTAGRPISTLQTGLVTAYVNFVEAVILLGNVFPGVWSRTDGDIYPIERVWCDNEWDTMRSRGGKSTSRVEETIS